MEVGFQLPLYETAAGREKEEKMERGNRRERVRWRDERRKEKVEEEEREVEVVFFFSFFTPIHHLLLNSAHFPSPHQIPKSFSPVFSNTETNEKVVETLRGRGGGSDNGGDGHLWILMGSSKCK